MKLVILRRKENIRSIMIYWENDEYVGFGAGAHGYVNGIRYSNHGPMKKYMETIDQGENTNCDAT